MDDSCAVCADDLEWVAYGSCGHREVCSTCVVRLRLVLADLRCCICKTESPIVFVTKAMGDYTRVVADFSVFPENPSEGQVGQFWYHEDSKAFFDDGDHYRMVKAMCKLSCSACDRVAEEQGEGVPRRRNRFRSIDQLKGHLFHQHKLHMCSLCLEGRKVFICEQKLYTRAQLTQHMRSGNSEVDGSESDRGGFMGHPMCDFCKDPFYGENELYMHMSREHYTCHICQRQHPGHYDYFRNYDDLEMHFRQEHFLCEDEACLAKKFVVFQTEGDMKRHNALEHGGNMSRSKRNAILQIPTSFRYRRNEDEQRRRNRGFRPEPSENLLSMAIQASFETASGRIHDTSATQPTTRGEASQTDDTRGRLESLAISSRPLPHAPPNQSSGNPPSLGESSFPSLVDREMPEPSSRYAKILSGSSKLGDASFPPLPGASSSSNPKSSSGSEGKPMNTLANRLQRLGRGPSVAAPIVARSADTRGNTSSSTWQNQGAPSHNMFPSISSTSQPTLSTKSKRENGFVSPSTADSAWNLNSGNRMKHSTSAPSLAEGQVSNQVLSAAVTKNQHSSHKQPLSQVEDVQMANKSLVERIRSCLDNDEERYALFKSISADYRQGSIGTVEYLHCVQQFGLSHLVPELARLLPDARKQKELVDVYNTNKFPEENGGSSSGSTTQKKDSKKKKGKMVAQPETSNKTTNSAADTFLDTVRKLQSSNIPQDGEVEVLSRDGYRPAKEKFSLSAREVSATPSSTGTNSGKKPNQESQSTSNTANSSQSGTGGSSKQKKKSSKFLRARLGDGSAAALFDPGLRNVSPERNETGDTESQAGVPVRGVWKNGGGQKLFTK